MERNVRLATENDANELSNLNQQFNGGNAVDPQTIKESIRNSNEIIAVASLNKKVVGFACAQSFQSFCYSEAQGEITEMFAEEAARRLGFASRMIVFLEERLSERGVKSIKIVTGKNNDVARKTYVENGYTIENDLVLEKNL